jgi:acyl-homoserine-lactone acylase
MRLRAQHSAAMLMEDDSITFEEMIEYKHSTHMESADRILDDLLSAVSNSNDGMVRQAGQVLDSWDRKTDSTSRGAVLLRPFSRN